MKKVKIGCDPEFVIKTPLNKVLFARHLIKDENKRKKFGQEYRAFELRPDPSDNVFEVMANIRHLLQQTIEKNPVLKSCSFVAGHYVDNNPLGGHIHIGLDKQRHLTEFDFRDFLTRVLYDGLARWIDDRAHRIQRRRNGYGYEDDIRNDNGKTIEYRTPPSWLASPRLAFMYLTLAKLCALIWLNEIEWGYSDFIDEILSNRKIGRNLLLFISKEVAENAELMAERDIRKCLLLISKLPAKNKKRDFSIDFKSAWNL